MSIGDELAEKKVSEIKRGFWYLARKGIRKIINNRFTKPKQMSLKKLSQKFTNLERLDIQISKPKDLNIVKKIFKEHQIHFSINKGVDKNAFSIFYPPKDISNVENAMTHILDKQIKVNKKIKDKGNFSNSNSKKVPLKEQIKRAEKIVKERNKEVDLKRELSKAKSISRGDLEL